MRPVTAYGKPNFLKVSLIFIFLLIFPPIFILGFILNYLEKYHITIKIELIAIVIIIYTLALIFIILPFLIATFSEGRIKVNSDFIEWIISGKKGKIFWKQPHSVSKWQSSYKYTLSYDIPYEQSIPVIIYEISQNGEYLVFYRSAGYDEVKNLPYKELSGFMIVYRARKLTKTIDEIEKYKWKL